MVRRVRITKEVHAGGGPGALFMLGDARVGLAELGRRGLRARAVYMDPPFLTGKDFGQYQDRLKREELMELLRAVSHACRELLLPDGSLYMHIDHRINAHCRLMLDEVFGEDNFRNEIIWAYSTGGRAKNHFSRKHDTILLYSRGRKMFFCPQAVALPRSQERANHMRRGVDEQGRAYASIRSGGKEYRYYDDEGVPPSDVWSDIAHLQQKDPERTGYPTQKPGKLLERILLASSQAGDWVIDPFSGSGTTLHTAHRLGRRGAAVDASAHALLSLRRRMIGSAMEILYIKEEVPEPQGLELRWGDVPGADICMVGVRQGETFFADEGVGGVPCMLVQCGECIGFYDAT